MSERKVLNKYFPPDFDPSKVPRRKIAKDKQEVIRLMAPFSMRCNTCGEYIYAGKKFNGRKETVQGEDYYGIKIFRFYIKCPTCSSEITFKTDPRNTDYTVEHGVSRNFEPWREGKDLGDDKDGKDGTDPLAHLLEEEGVVESDDEDPMKALEKRTQESKREMEVMDALQDIRSRNARLDRVNVDDVLQNYLDKGKAKVTAEEEERLHQEEEDEVLIRKYFGKDLATAEEAGAVKSRAGDSDSRESATTEFSPLPNEAQEPAIPISIKRARAGDDEGGEVEPDVTSILSENAKMHLLAPSLSTTKASTLKKKKGSSAFGIVRKKSVK
ncbi:hypothetical protein CBS101457_004294 [Exobasidium rhododendri]|nr:hypothetical protein CBS101457_004294 [Exobasidium rhododendri]